MAHAAAAQSVPFDTFAVWSPRDGVRGISLLVSEGMRLLAGSPADCCLYGVDADGYLVSRLRGIRILHPDTSLLVKIEVPAVVYLFLRRADGEVVTLAAERRAGRYEINIAPASCSRPAWVPLTPGTRCYVDAEAAQAAGDAEHGARIPRAPAPLFTA